MYRVALALLKHEIEQHSSPGLVEILRHFRTVCVVAGPLLAFVADWLIPLAFLWRSVSVVQNVLADHGTTVVSSS